MSARDDRIEHYYNWSAWDLAERIVDLEDERAKTRAEVLRDAAEAIGRMRDETFTNVAVYPLYGADTRLALSHAEYRLRRMAEGAS